MLNDYYKRNGYISAKCEHVELINDDGELYLFVKYILERDGQIQRLTIPRIRLGFNVAKVPTIDSASLLHNLSNPFTSYLPCYHICGGRDKTFDIELHNGKSFAVEILEEKTHKLTVAEIEKRLGYKIEIVSGEGAK